MPRDTQSIFFPIIFPPLLGETVLNTERES
jgi:hypothetical protein